MLPDFDEHLVRAFLQGLVQSALARGADPAIRLQQFRALQQAKLVMTQDPVADQAAERLVRATDLCLQEWMSVRS